MKTVVAVFAVLGIAFSHLYAEEPNYDTEIGYNNESSYLGFSAEDSVQESIATSMIGWGVGMALAIGVVAGVIRQSGNESDSTSPSHAHAHSD